jgi:hypothetical protein
MCDVTQTFLGDLRLHTCFLSSKNIRTTNMASLPEKINNNNLNSENPESANLLKIESRLK